MHPQFIHACIFDLDGVLVNTAHYHFLSWKQITLGWNVPFTEQDNELLKGLSREDSLSRLLQITGKQLNAAEREHILQEKNKLFQQYLEQMTPDDVLPGVHDFLIFLRNNNIHLAVASSSKNARIVLQKTELTKWFEVIIDGTQIKKAKPDPEVFLKAAHELGIAPLHAVVFEDAKAGVEAARTGGFYCVGVGDPTMLSQAHRVIPDFTSISFDDWWQSLSDSFTQVVH